MDISGTLMSKDREIATIRNGRLAPICESLLPLYLQSHDDFEGWLSVRAIDSSRANAHLLKKALRLTTCSDPELVLSVNAASVIDTYWFRPMDSQITFSDVCFKQNKYANMALAGDPAMLSEAPAPTPELTSIGSFEKAWYQIDGQWWLYKQGKPEELFSELFICRLGQMLDYPMAEYELADGYIRSPDFTHGASVNFESVWGLVGEDEDYARSYQAIARLSPAAASKFIAMITLDTICLNVDRHTHNYGVLRDAETGKTLDFAPNFDNNVALNATGYSKITVGEKDLLMCLFVEFLKSSPDALRSYKTEWHRDITPNMVRECVQQIPIVVDSQYVVDLIVSRANLLQQLLFSED